MAGAVPVQRRELVRVQPRHDAGDLGLDMVHLRVVGKLNQVALHRPLLKPCEHLLHLGTVVRLTLVTADRDPCAVNPHGVPDPLERLPQRLRLRGQRGEALGSGVLAEVAAEPVEAARGHLTCRKLPGQHADRRAVDVARVQEPCLFLQLVVELLRLLEVPAHPPHRLREPVDRIEHLARLKVTQNLMPVPDSVGLVQRRAEQRFQVVLLAPRGHRLQHLIKVQVGEELRPLRPAGAGACPGPLEQDALEAHRGRLRARRLARARAVRRAGRAGAGQVRHHQLPPGRAREKPLAVAAVSDGFHCLKSHLRPQPPACASRTPAGSYHASCRSAAERSTGAISHQGDSGELHHRDPHSTATWHGPAGSRAPARPAWHRTRCRGGCDLPSLRRGATPGASRRRPACPRPHGHIMHGSCTHDLPRRLWNVARLLPGGLSERVGRSGTPSRLRDMRDSLNRLHPRAAADAGGEDSRP